jgi:hypothetical protein
MANLVHITSARAARQIERSGIAARSHGRAGERGVYCAPVLPSFTLTYQWVRELRRSHAGVLVAVHLRLPDDEPVTVGHYGAEPNAVTAAQAVATIRQLDDPRGHEIFVPRAIGAAMRYSCRARSARPRCAGSATFRRESDGDTYRGPTTAGPARAPVAWRAAATKWTGCAAGSRSRSRPGPRAS